MGGSAEGPGKRGRRPGCPADEQTAADARHADDHLALQTKVLEEPGLVIDDGVGAQTGDEADSWEDGDYGTPAPRAAAIRSANEPPLPAPP
ncbi:hypothetical protein [Streptomyces sp. Ncost-T10-10d]|uniref:hypothetical protein n=1 Tax=Streptomyces sp. Ncost-T10-10d TaxID=1839774 RepID=UPI00114C8DDA|nr:hypothetical protein [Streptomyces sp. Ncost-T10-10d]